MMLCVGLDIHQDKALVARVSSDLGRPVVDRLDEVCLDEIAGQPWLNSCHPIIGVDDSRVQVKSLSLELTQSISFRAAGEFELAQSLLEPADQFLLATYQTGLDESYVGTICRIAELERLVDRLGLAPRDRFQPGNFIIRSAALGAGYTTYCQNEPGELVGLIDLGCQSAAICLIYRGRPISLAHMPLAAANSVDNDNDDDAEQLGQLAVQAKTMINFQISRLSGAGLNLPLATLILSGDRASQTVCEAFAGQFPSGVKLPTINPAFLIDSLSDRDDTSRYLVAMGLAFNSL